MCDLLSKKRARSNDAWRFARLNRAHEAPKGEVRRENSPLCVCEGHPKGKNGEKILDDEDILRDADSAARGNGPWCYAWDCSPQSSRTGYPGGLRGSTYDTIIYARLSRDYADKQ